MELFKFLSGSDSGDSSKPENNDAGYRDATIPCSRSFCALCTENVTFGD